MAYTYEDFTKAATDAGVLDRFSQNDLTVAQKNPEYGLSMVGLLQDVAGATTAEQRLLATEAANQMRKSYGVYKAADGTGSYASSHGSAIDDLMGQVGSYGSFDYAGQDAYQKLLESVANPEPFSYDPASDPSWGAYKKAYRREGDRASANALAQTSAASGGRASSYAQTAAQQAGNYYAGQLSDMLPTLEQNAYNRYLSDFNNRLSGLNAMSADRAFDYENWMNEYNMLQNNLGNHLSQDATDYQRYLDAYNQQQAEKLNAIAQDQQKFENAMALYKELGYATPEVAEILGISAAGGSGGTASGGGGGYSSGGLTAEQIRQLQTALGVTADGIYGPNSMAAAGGLSAQEAYEKFIGGNVSAWGTGDITAALRDAYPGGVISDTATWDNLSALYGEDALRNAGLKLSVATGSQAGAGAQPGGYKQLTQDLNSLVAAGATKSDISGLIHSAVSAGVISQNQAQALLKTYNKKAK